MSVLVFFAILGKATIFLIFSYFLVHLVALFGFFFALAYPVIWFIVPRATICLFCHIKKEGEICPLCHEVVYKQAGIYPKRVSSILANGLIIFLMSLVCLGVVLVEYRLVAGNFFYRGKTAAFHIPSRSSHKLAEIFPMQLEVAGLKAPINAVRADVGFDTNRLEVVDVNTADSFATVIIEKEIDNLIGYVRLSGGVPNPGFNDAKGTFGTIYFRGKTPGLAQVEFLPSSLILANDGRGTNIIRDYGTVSYLILPEEATEEEKQNGAALVGKKVLGSRTDKTRLDFTQDEPVVLGEMSAVEGKKAKTGFLSSCVLVLEKIDGTILSFWSTVFRLDRPSQ